MRSEAKTVEEYLSAIYSDEGARGRFEAAYKVTGKRFDVGKSCVRFKKLEGLPLDVIGNAIGGVPLDDFVAQDERGRDVSRR